MQPLKSKELISDVAKQLHLPAKTVEDITNFYWNQVWDALTHAEYPKVHVTNLGDFNIKHWLIDKNIAKAESFTTHTFLKGTQKWAATQKINDRLTTLKKLKEKILEENQRKDFITQHKQSTYETNINRDLEKQGPDTGGY